MAEGWIMVKLVWTIAILLALIGVAMIAYTAWKPIRAWRRRGKACVRCGYPRARGGNAPARCPECGTEYAAMRSQAHIALAWVLGVVRVALAVAMLAPIATLIWPYRAGRVLEPLFVTWVESSRQQLGTSTYVREEMAFRAEILNRASQDLQRFNIYVGMEAGALQRGKLIDSAGRIAFQTEGRGVVLGSPVPPEDRGAVATAPFWVVDPATDIDADGVPDVIVETYSGGAHCCWTYDVISLSDPPRVTFTLESEGGASFELDPTADGNTTLICVPDMTWAYWNACYACSPRTRVVMRLERGQTTIVASALRMPAPASDALAAEAARVRDQIRADLGSDGTVHFSNGDYWRTPLELMYTGHEDLAWKFFDDAWPEGVPGKDAFLGSFRATLDQSPYWSRVKAAFAAE